MTVTDGSLVEAQEVMGGYWMIDVKSKQEAIDWVKRCPAEDGDTLDVRPFFELEDFPIEFQEKMKNARK